MRKRKNVVCIAALVVSSWLIGGCDIDALPEGVTAGIRNGVAGLIEQLITSVGEGVNSGG